MQTRSANKRPERAFTFLEMVVTVTIVGLVAAYVAPVIVRARSDSRLSVIYVNLWEVESAKDRWALDQNKMVGEPVPDLEVLTNYICWAKFSPVDHEAYMPNPVGSLPTAVLSDTTRIGPYGPGQTIVLPSKTPPPSDAQPTEPSADN
jgi:prepilin-type N-terminal cleavage/methylation domain-containing protein